MSDMEPSGDGPIRPRAGPEDRGLRLFLGMFLLYSATSAGFLDNIDAECRYSAAMSLVRHGDLDVDMHYVRGRLRTVSALGPTGRRYAVYSPGQAFLMVPFCLAGRGVAVLAGLREGPAGWIGEALASIILFPLVAAALCAAFRALQRDLGVAEPFATGAAVLLGLGTMMWEYSKFPSEETQVGVLLLVGFRHGLLYARGSSRWRDLAAFGGCLAGAHVFRLTAAPAAAVISATVLAVALLSREGSAVQRRRKASGLALAAMAGAIAAAASAGLYNWWCTGSPIESPYSAALVALFEGESVRGSFAAGLAGLFLSPGKSVFLYNPILMVVAALSGRWARRLGWAGLVVPGAMLSTGLLYAGFSRWHGDWAWGPRFLASTLPLALLPLGMVMEELSSLRGRALRNAGAVAIVSVVLQLLAVSMPYGIEYAQREPGDYFWNPAQSAIVMRAGNLARRIGGTREHEGARLTFYVWPNNINLGRARGAIPPLVAVWFACLVGAALLLHRALGPPALWLAAAPGRAGPPLKAP